MIAIEIGVQFGEAFRTDAMAELGFGMTSDVVFEFFPSAAIVPDPLAGRTDGQETLQHLELVEGALALRRPGRTESPEIALDV